MQQTGQRCNSETIRKHIARLFYVHDPMCSWCWGFSPVFKQFLSALSKDIKVVRLLGGLAKDSDVTMPDDLQKSIMQTWRRIEEVIPGIKFNFDFWTKCQARRSTYPACRAVIAARRQGQKFDELMTHVIQKAYYQQARNPSDESVLVELSGELGLDNNRFINDIRDQHTNEILLNEISTAQQMGVDGFPALVLQKNSELWHIPVNYTDATPMLQLVLELLSSG